MGKEKASVGGPSFSSLSGDETIISCGRDPVGRYHRAASFSNRSGILNRYGETIFYRRIFRPCLFHHDKNGSAIKSVGTTTQAGTDSLWRGRERKAFGKG